MEERKGFGTNFGFLMASVGSAVGLGNIWGFPNKMGASGGFTFLVVYLVLAVLAGWASCPRSLFCSSTAHWAATASSTWW